MKTLIIGAGSAGQMVAQEILNSTDYRSTHKIIGFLDDHLVNSPLAGLPVLGPIKDAANIIKKYAIDEIIIAIPSATRDQIQTIVDFLSGSSAKIRIVPGIREIIEGDVHLDQIREIQSTDLLGREEVIFDPKELTPAFQNKTILITGAGGSIGSELVDQLLQLPVKQILCLGRGEGSLFNLLLKQKWNQKLIPILADITHPQRMEAVFRQYQPQIIFHTAAHKHVPFLELFPDEAVRNNILGTHCVLRNSVQFGAEKLVLISTDKAANPTTVLGLSKRIGEEITLAFAEKYPQTQFIVTRFGNVLGSRGSVVQIFNEQIQAGGPVTVTDPLSERYFMSIREASRLVIQSSLLEGKNTYVLEMGKPIRILDLAKKMIQLYGTISKKIEVKFIGLRAGDKISESLLDSSETSEPTRFQKIQRIVRKTKIKQLSWIDETLKQLASSSKEALDKALK